MQDENSRVPEGERPGSLRLAAPKRPAGLAGIAPIDLALEILYRLDQPAGLPPVREPEIRVAQHLADALKGVLDVYLNRRSRLRYWKAFEDYHRAVRPRRPPLRGATYVDLGCGSVNPYGLLFLFLALGAQRGVAIDFDGVEDAGAATKALAELAAMLLVDPRSIVEEYPVTREQILANLTGFDLARLNAGDPGGIDRSRLEYRKESVYSMTLADAEADVVVSNAFLEHVDRVDDALAELARVTRPHGFGVHVIDGRDHRAYGDASLHPLDFLRMETRDALVYGSNRLRPTAFRKRFEAHGFEVLDLVICERIALDEPTRRSFVEPYRSMAKDDLESTIVRFVVRRR